MNYNSILIDSKFAYCHLQGLIWESNGLNTPFNLDINTGKNLSKIYLHTEKNKPLVINCSGLLDSDDHSFSSIFQLIDSNDRPLYFLNSKDLKVRFDSLIKEFIKNDIHIIYPDKKTLVISRKKDYFSIESLYNSCSEIEDDLIKEYVYNSFELFEDNAINRLPSTPIVGTGVYNSNNLISEPKAFMWLSIKISNKLNEILSTRELDSEDAPEIKLLTVSMRSSPFAAAVGLLNNIEIEVIDHLGPKYKIFDIDEVEAIFWSDNFIEYIYIGDFAFGGTEIKIAQSIASLTGCKLDKALVIGNLIPTENFEDSFQLHSLINLQNLNDNAKFALFENEIR